MTSAPVTGLPTFERMLVGVVLSLALTSVLALLLAQVGIFQVSFVIAIFAGFVVAIAAGAGFAAGRLVPRTEHEKAATGSDRVSILLLCIVVVTAAAVFTPPFQTTLWGGDSTLYVGYGVQIARTGAFVFEDPLLTGMPSETREELFRNQTENDMTGSRARFPGGIGFVDFASGRVAPGFSPLFLIWLAIFAQVFGASQVFWASAFFGVCGVAAAFCLGRELHSPQAGFWASLWLLACMPQIWFSRIPMSETLSQFFLLGGMWVALLYLRTESRFLGVAGGLVLGIAGLAGFDVVIVTTAGILAFVVVRAVAGRRIANARYFVTGYSTAVVYGLVHLVHYPTNYGAFFEERLSRLPFGAAITSVWSATTPDVWLALVLAVLLSSALVFVRLTRTFVSDERVRAQVVALTLGLALALYLTVYVVASMPRYHDTVRWFPAYLSLPVVGLFLAGLVGVVWRRVVVARDADAAAVLAGFAVASIPLVYNPQLQDFGVHIGTMRRFVPFVIPGIFILAAVSFVWFSQRLSPAARWAVVPLGAVLSLALVAQPSTVLLGNRMWDNGVAESSELAAMFPPGAVILVAPDLVGVQAQSALTFWYGYGGVALNRSYGVERLVEDQVVRWLREGREVFLLSATSSLHFDGSGLSLSEHGTDELTVRTLPESSWLPYEAQVRRVRMTAYRFGLDPAPKAHVDVGSYLSDALFPLSGFYDAETDSVAGRYRWTGARASIEVPAAGGIARVALVIQGARPPGIAPAVVSIAANGGLALENTIISGQPSRIEIDLGELGVGDLDPGAPLKITIESSTFNPRRAGLSNDGRDLGVRVYRADFER